MFTQPGVISLKLPTWIQSFAGKYHADKSIEHKMSFVISASRENIMQKSGGPFAAAVFDMKTDELIALGTNLVVKNELSILHAEIVAISLSQNKLGTHDLSSSGRHLQLVTSSEPCAMCFGAILWSGIQSIVCGATKSDVENIGFDEGPKPKDWKAALASRHIDVETEVLREDAREVLEVYQSQNGIIYNPC